MPQPAAAIVGQIAAPVVAALLEDVHAYVSTEAARIAAAAPKRLDAAEQEIQDWAHDAADLAQRVMARLDSARGNLTAAETATSTSASAPTTAPTAATTTATKPTPADATTEPKA